MTLCMVYLHEKLQMVEYFLVEWPDYINFSLIIYLSSFVINEEIQIKVMS